MGGVRQPLRGLERARRAEIGKPCCNGSPDPIAASAASVATGRLSVRATALAQLPPKLPPVWP